MPGLGLPGRSSSSSSSSSDLVAARLSVVSRSEDGDEGAVDGFPVARAPHRSLVRASVSQMREAGQRPHAAAVLEWRVRRVGGVVAQAGRGQGGQCGQKGSCCCGGAQSDVNQWGVAGEWRRAQAQGRRRQGAVRGDTLLLSLAICSRVSLRYIAPSSILWGLLGFEFFGVLGIPFVG
jgi:hypothetical protein